MTNIINRFLPLYILISFFIVSCGLQIRNIRNIYEVSFLTPEDIMVIEGKYIKVHLRDGRVAVLNKWNINNADKVITGKGHLFDLKRKAVTKKSTEIKLDFDRCLLIETNQYEGDDVLSTTMMVLSTLQSVATIPCVLDPKACFGSCPTFYLHKKDTLFLQAEGFSSSITKSMEEVDIDPLPAYENGELVSIEVKNEALETHYIRNIELLAFKKPSAGSIQYGSNTFYEVDQLSQPLSIENDSTNQKILFNKIDHAEYLSPSDSEKLNQKESIIFNFSPHQGINTGVLITQRQSLLTTFLFYQSIAYMGHRAGAIMAAYERASPLVRVAQTSIYDILGGIEISVFIDNQWKPIGTVDEQGPIVSKTQIIPVDMVGQFEKVKLTMTKGLWRIDQLALCKINKRNLDPVIISPHRLIYKGIHNDSILQDLNDEEVMMVNNPGTAHTLEFKLPENQQSQIFLKSQGYYVEWIRNEWLQEENLEMTNMILQNPEEWLREMAPKYKNVEHEMEALFWSSKYINHEY